MPDAVPTDAAPTDAVPTAPAVHRLLVVVAHPDDPDFPAGGTIAALAGRGTHVTYVIVTDGSKGTGDRTLSGPRLAAMRVDEQWAAARALGVADVVFLGIPDGEVVPDLALRHAITRQIRLHRPDVVITHDPATFYTDTYVNHPDHRAVGQATLEAIFPTARDFLNAPHLLAEEGLDVHKVREAWLTLSLRPDHFVDIAATIDRKIAALHEHRSQFTDPDGLAMRIRERAALVGEANGMALAEGFKRIVLPE